MRFHAKSVRRWIQIFFFLLIGTIAVNKTLSETGAGIPFLSSASLHALCPFGGVVTFYQFVTAGTFVQKVHMSSLILMALVFILAILFGPVFCGWVCPLGTIQEWIGKLGRKVFKQKYNHFIPIKADFYLRYFRYGFLIWVVFVIARSGQLLFENVDPYNALFSFWNGEVAVPSLIILGITLAASLFVERPWCKYACPYGALLGVFNKVRIFKIRRNSNSCISCRKCDRSCPMNIEVSNQEKITNLQCISCYRCTSEFNCPVPETVQLAAGGNRRMQIPAGILAVALGLVIFGGIGVTMAADLWTTSNDKVPAKYEKGDYSDDYNPADIRGSYTFQEIADLFKIDLKLLTQAFSTPELAVNESTKVKDLESIYAGSDAEIGKLSVQTFVAFYKGLPYEWQDAYLPENAVHILLEKKDLSVEQMDYLTTHTVAIPAN